MSDKPWIDAYQTRRWESFPLPTQSSDVMLLEAVSEPVGNLINCYAESEKARRQWEHTGNVDGLFFVDLEQLLGMELDAVYGHELRRLTDSWREYPKGSLVLTVYTGVCAREPNYTIGVSRP